MANTLKTQIAKSTEAARKSFRAYVGLHGAAYDRIVPVFKTASKNYDELAVKGEALENSAQSIAKEARERVQKTYTETFGKVRSVLPRAANDRVEELESEIARLNKKIKTLAKKAPKKAPKKAAPKKAAKTTAKTVETTEVTKAA